MQVPEEAASDLFCEECERRYAVGRCEDCEETLCAVCLAILHIPSAGGRAHMHLALVRISSRDCPSALLYVLFDGVALARKSAGDKWRALTVFTCLDYSNGPHISVMRRLDSPRKHTPGLCVSITAWS